MSEVPHGARAGIFDLDGVLVDTAIHHYRAWRRLALSLGFDLSPAQNELLKGVSRMRCLQIVLDIGGYRCGEEEKLRLAEAKNAWYVQSISGMTSADILPGAREFLAAVRGAGWLTAVASASRNAATILRAVGLRDAFDAVVDGSRVSAAKPDPQAFLLAARLLGVEPRACVVFEDAAAGVEAARRAGMPVVGIGSPDNLAADLVVPGLAGLSLEVLPGSAHPR